MKNKEIADLFNELADILELRGENIFRINAYRRAAQTIESLPRPVEEISSEGKLDDLPGIVLAIGSVRYLRSSQWR